MKCKGDLVPKIAYLLPFTLTQYIFRNIHYITTILINKISPKITKFSHRTRINKQRKQTKRFR